MSESQWMSLVAMLGVLALVAWRLPGRMMLWGLLLALAIVGGAVVAERLGFTAP